MIMPGMVQTWPDLLGDSVEDAINTISSQRPDITQISKVLLDGSLSPLQGDLRVIITYEVDDDGTETVIDTPYVSRE